MQSHLDTQRQPPAVKPNHVAGLLLAAWFCALGAQAQIIVNGGFESPAIPADTLLPAAPDGWSVDPHGYTHTGYIMNGKYGDIWPWPQSGQQYFDVGNGSTYVLSQTFSVTAPGSYQLDWFATAATSVDFLQYFVTIKDAAETTVASGSYDDATRTAWRARSLGMTLGAGAYTLSFMPGDVGGDLLVDTVALTLVPEPGAWALLAALGLAGFTVGRRFCRRK